MGMGLELVGRRKDGTVFPVEIGLSTVVTGEGRLGVAFVTDTTERKRVDALLRQRDQEVKALLDNSPDVIVRFDHNLRYTYANVAFEKATGYPRETVIGRTQRVTHSRSHRMITTGFWYHRLQTRNRGDIRRLLIQVSLQAFLISSSLAACI